MRLVGEILRGGLKVEAIHLMADAAVIALFCAIGWIDATFFRPVYHKEERR